MRIRMMGYLYERSNHDDPISDKANETVENTDAPISDKATVEQADATVEKIPDPSVRSRTGRGFKSVPVPFSTNGAVQEKTVSSTGVVQEVVSPIVAITAMPISYMNPTNANVAHLEEETEVNGKLALRSSYVKTKGWLPGSKADGDSNQLPTIAIVASYDTFGAAPALSVGSDSNGSGVVALLEIARLFSILYSNPNTRGRYNILFGLTSGGPYNYNGTQKGKTGYGFMFLNLQFEVSD
ncbi:EF-hand 1, calcium-binding site-containing protein [Tanacetum coccineum]